MDERFMIKSDNHKLLSPASLSLGKRVLTDLYKLYPVLKDGWCVTINEGGGIISVTNQLLSGKMGFILHVTQIDPEGKTVMRAGGELLERYAVRRHPGLTLEEALHNTQFNRHGQMELAK